jgi:hypothetical protein
MRGFVHAEHGHSMAPGIKAAMIAGAGALLLSSAQAATDPVVLREHDALSVSPSGDRVVNVEALDPGNLPEEAHGAVVVRAAGGTALAPVDTGENSQ